ncbi:hypothetical protein AOA80_10810 [Methanomassiliicoccales archaeon RumEn M1]|nr:hypothetical protein AOA80_10810 [Methanomassiliicoccales archaeon RumEn M1]
MAKDTPARDIPPLRGSSSAQIRPRDRGTAQIAQNRLLVTRIGRPNGELFGIGAALHSFVRIRSGIHRLARTVTLPLPSLVSEGVAALGAVGEPFLVLRSAVRATHELLPMNGSDQIKIDA